MKAARVPLLCAEKIRALARDEKGSVVLEAVIVIAVVLAIALIFNTQIKAFADKLFTAVFSDNNIFSFIGG